MKKELGKGYILLIALFALITLLVILVPTNKTASFWTVYIFTAVSFLVNALVFRKVLKSKEVLKSKFIGLPIAFISGIYLCVQIVLLAVFLLLADMPMWAALLICIIICGSAFVLMISSDSK